MTVITDNGFARISKETLILDPTNSRALTGDDIAYNETLTINEKISTITGEGLIAENVINVPSGNLVATNVQDALDELQSELDTKAPALGANDNYVTDDEKVVIGNTSGTNTGDNSPNTNSGIVHTVGNESIGGVKTFTSPLITNGAINFNAPEGFMVNGKIVPTVASGNLTITLTGTSASLSATNPCYVMIGGVTRTITSNLVVVVSSGASVLDAGSSELATKEIDFFTHLFWYDTATPARVGICIARLPIVTDLSIGYLDEKGIYYDYDGHLVSATTPSVNIGRFAATLSAGAGYTWSIPTYTASNLIQRPIYETRTVVGSNWTPTLTWNGTAPTGGTNKNFVYNLVGDKCYISGSVYNMTAGVANSLLTVTLPFAARGGAVNLQLINSMISNGATPNLTMGEINYYSTGLSINCSPVNATYLQFQGFYNI